jgi:hypothetical protein
MWKRSVLWIVPAVALLAGCANTAPPPRTAASDCGFHFTGGSGLLGVLGAAGAFERPAGPECRRTSAAGRQAGQVLDDEEGEAAPVGSMVGAPNFGGGQTVYSQGECIGAVVMGQCHGSILPDYSRPHPTCYGQLLNGICTGPMF